jgi:hypothetical protein
VHAADIESEIDTDPFAPALAFGGLDVAGRRGRRRHHGGARNPQQPRRPIAETERQ